MRLVIWDAIGLIITSLWWRSIQVIIVKQHSSKSLTQSPQAGCIFMHVSCKAYQESHKPFTFCHYADVIMRAMASQITGVSIVYSTVCSGASKKITKAPRHWLCEGCSPVTGGFPSQRASNAENVPVWWRHHVTVLQGWTLPDSVTSLAMEQTFDRSNTTILMQERRTWIFRTYIKV